MNMPSFWKTSIKDATPALAARSAPIVWTQSTTIDLEDYTKNGFLVSKGALNSTLPQRLEGILDEIKNSRRGGRIHERGSSKLRSQFDIHNQFPSLISLVFPDWALKLSTEILGGAPLIYQSHVNFKYANGGGEFDWHSDYTYWRDQDGMLQPRAISVIIPLERHGPENGGLCILKGSHNLIYTSNLKYTHTWSADNILHDHQESRFQSGLAPMDLLNSNYIQEIHSAEMQFGDFMIMDANAWHYSSENKSNSNRTTLFVILIAKDTPFNERLKNYRPPEITCRKGVPIESLLERNSWN